MFLFLSICIENNVKAIEIKSIRFSYNDKEVIKDISFSLKHGEFLGIIGPKRMPYERMIALIDYLSKLMSTVLTSREVVSIE